MSFSSGLWSRSSTIRPDPRTCRRTRRRTSRLPPDTRTRSCPARALSCVAGTRWSLPEAFVEEAEPLNREARMTVAAAQGNLAELRSELETLQDFSHMLRAQRLTQALGELARVVEDQQTGKPV